jgi:hypothetical protein
MAEHIEDDDDRDWQQNRLRDMLDDAINDMLIRMRVIGPRAKETL